MSPSRVKWVCTLVLAALMSVGYLGTSLIPWKGAVATTASLLLVFALFAVPLWRAHRPRGLRGFTLMLRDGADITAIAALLASPFFPLRVLLEGWDLRVVDVGAMALESITLSTVMGLLATVLASILVAVVRAMRPVTVPVPAPVEGTRRGPASYIPIAACLVAVVLVAATFSRHGTISPRSDVGPAIGQPAPDGTVSTLDGQPWKISEQRGKVVVIDFWATWCGPCLESFPMLARLQRTYGSRPDFVLVGVSIDRDRRALDRVLAGRHLPWTTLYAGENGPLARQFEVQAVPSLWIIGKDGRIAAKSLHQEEELVAALRDALR